MPKKPTSGSPSEIPMVPSGGGMASSMQCCHWNKCRYGVHLRRKTPISRKRFECCCMADAGASFAYSLLSLETGYLCSTSDVHLATLCSQSRPPHCEGAGQVVVWGALQGWRTAWLQASPLGSSLLVRRPPAVVGTCWGPDRRGPNPSTEYTNDLFGRMSNGPW